ncbi:unnamed protein product [Urochloa humidicola]
MIDMDDADSGNPLQATKYVEELHMLYRQNKKIALFKIYGPCQNGKDHQQRKHSQEPGVYLTILSPTLNVG